MDVVLDPGVTALEPTQTGFFQALGVVRPHTPYLSLHTLQLTHTSLSMPYTLPIPLFPYPAPYPYLSFHTLHLTDTALSIPNTLHPTLHAP